MISDGSSGNAVNLGPYSSAQGHGDATGGTRMSCNEGWVWPPLRRTNNLEMAINGEGTCSCASQITRQHQQQQHQMLNINPLMVPVVGHSNWHNSSLPNSSAAPLLENNTKPLRFLFGKELTYSDVLKKNKIILPKKDAETYFPYISSKLGIRLYMEDSETKGIWCFILKYRNTNRAKIYTLEGTKHFLRVHDLKPGDYIGIYIDDDTKRFVIGVSKEVEAKEVVDEESSVNTNTNVNDNVTNVNDNECVASNLNVVANSTNSYIYLDNLSDFSVVDDMELEATPSTPYPYGNATLSDGGLEQSCHLERLTPLPDFEFSDLPLDYISWT